MRNRQASRLNQRVMTGVIAMGIIVLLVCFLFLSMVSCSGGAPSFRLSGHVSGAADSMLVVEHVSLEGVVPVDSVRLSASGEFALSIPRDMPSLGAPDSAAGRQLWAPDFYRLRIGRRVVNFAVDSTEDITVEAPLEGLASAYDIHGNAASRTMKTIALLNLQLQTQFRGLDTITSLSALEKVERARQLVANYKHTLMRDYIIPDPASPAAYFALFQTLGGAMLFNPETERADVQAFAAVATQWQEHYPHAQRTENVCNIAMRGIANTRPARVVELQLDGDKVRETGIIDMGFPDINGRERRLSELADNVVLLDFTTYSAPQSKERTLLLRDLYQRYHARGFEIYQVSLDSDSHFWKTMTEALPWVCVQCAEGFDNDIVSLYGVTSLPTFFIVGRGSELKARDSQITDIRRAIEDEL